MERGKFNVLACQVLVLLMLYRFARLAYCSASLSPDGMALLEVKMSLNMMLIELQMWSESDASLCHWEGITCTELGFVDDPLAKAKDNFQSYHLAHLGLTIVFDQH